jgi:hypothetical protein
MSRVLGEGEANFYMFLVILFDKTANNEEANLSFSATKSSYIRKKRVLLKAKIRVFLIYY